VTPTFVAPEPLDQHDSHAAGRLGRLARRDRIAFAFMPCLPLLLALISPRLALVAVWLFSNVLSRAFDSLWLPFLGFFLLPWTTLAYALTWDLGTHEVKGFEWFVVVLAFLADLGAYGGTARGRN
jgi:hypothetical protein